MQYYNNSVLKLEDNTKKKYLCIQIIGYPTDFIVKQVSLKISSLQITIVNHTITQLLALSSNLSCIFI
jgi:hypothetical protein